MSKPEPIIIGLTGPKGAGKDTVADFLVEQHGYVRMAFADALRLEVCKAFDIAEFILTQRETKEHPMSQLALNRCMNQEFIKQAHGDLYKPRSPRQIMQWWGTEYRRAQRSNYWTFKLEDAIGLAYKNGQHRFVITDVRFIDEADMLLGLGATLWQIQRPGHEPQPGEHSSETTGAQFAPHFVLTNNASISHLQSQAYAALKKQNQLHHLTAQLAEIEDQKPDSTPQAYRAQQHEGDCYDETCPGCAPQRAAHIVLDLETLSTQPHAIVVAIGAVALTAHGESVSEFHMPVICSSQPTRHLDAGTCAWWDKQADEAKAASILAADAVPASEALQAFSAWVQAHTDTKKVKVWGNGSNFDNVILSSLYADHPDLARPWAYWNDRDMRTLLDLHPHAKDVGPFEGIKHHALHDARHEGKQLAVVLKAVEQSVAQEATEDMLSTAWTELEMLREALGVSVEPHQSLIDRMLEAAEKTAATRYAAFEAVRRKFCKLQRYSFFLDEKGNVRRVPQFAGNWVEFEAVHTLFEPASVDAAIAGAKA